MNWFGTDNSEYATKPTDWNRFDKMTLLKSFTFLSRTFASFAVIKLEPKYSLALPDQGAIAANHGLNDSDIGHAAFRI